MVKPANFVSQEYKEFYENGGMFRSEAGVQKVSVTNGFRYRAYVSDSWGGGVQCLRDTKQEALDELPRLWKKMFG